MFKDLIQLYSVGKDLGLSRKEINRILLFQKKQNIFIKLLVIIIAAVITFFVVWNFVVLSRFSTSNSTYGHGIRYSSISIKDFKKKHEIKYWLWKKI